MRLFTRAAILLVIGLAGCGESPATGSSTSGGGHGGSGTSTGSGGAPSAICSAVTDVPAVLLSPDPRVVWAGAVAIIPSTLPMNVPLAGWRVDAKAQPVPSPTHPFSILDTTALTDGVHALSLDAVEADQSIKTYDLKFCVENGPAPSPPFKGQLTDVTAAAGLPSKGGDAASLLFSGAVDGDFDGDGHADLFLWNSAGTTVYRQTGALQFTAAPGPSITGVQAAGVADLDGDGDPDVVAAGDTLSILENAGGALTDVTAAAVPGLDLQQKYRFRSVTFADVDGDGLLDIAVSQLDCNQGGKNLVLRNEGGLHFADVGGGLGLAAPDGASYGMALDPVAGDGSLDVWLFHEGCRPGKTTHLRFAPGGDLPATSTPAQPALKAISPMGSAYFDADGDGALDFWVAGDFTSQLWKGPAFVDPLSAHAGLDAFSDGKGGPVSAWSMVLLDADLDGRPDFYVPHSPSDPIFGSPESSRDAIFWQRAPGSFRDVAAVAGLSGTEPCRAAHGADLDGDGDTDLLIGCTDRFRLLRNDLVDPTPGRTLRLHGTLSNTEGVGALVKTPGGEQRLVRGGGTPYAGGVVHESVRAPSGMLTVRWPSGITQTIDAGTKPVLDITEPAVAKVTPRRVPTGGMTTVAVEVSPAAMGDPAAGVKVDAGQGTFAKPLAKDPDGVWRGTFTPPAMAATVVLTVSIGGKPLLVRPRIFVR